MIKKVHYITFIYLVFSSLVTSQTNIKEDSSFDSIIGFKNTGIYYGKSNVQYLDISKKNHPFFGTFDYQKGSLIYHNQKYEDVQLRFDIVTEEIQILPQNETNLPSITLFTGMLDSFTIGEVYFIKLKNFKSNKKLFEILIENSRFSLLKHHQKETRKRIEKKITHYDYNYSTLLYLIVDDELIPIKSKKQILQIFNKNKEVLNQLFKKNNIRKISNEILILKTLEDWNRIITVKNKSLFE